MKLIRLCLAPGLFFVAALIGSHQAYSGSSDPQEGTLTTEGFKELMKTVADGWNEGNARKSVECFTEDAIYTEPPDKQFYQGQKSLYKFFGGDEGRPGLMEMTWHHLTFDESSQVGAGEFTFKYGTRVHGMVIVKVRDGKIANWREYFKESELEWGEFIGKNNF